jgi:hypothetical protein
VADFDKRYAERVLRIVALDETGTTVIHGDLFEANILVNEAGIPGSVLAFGFVSTAGDPRFDAAITNSIMNMYGRHAAAWPDPRPRLWRPSWDATEALLAYGAAYAVATSNAFSDDGSDGHFQWCAVLVGTADSAEHCGRCGQPVVEHSTDDARRHRRARTLSAAAGHGDSTRFDAGVKPVRARKPTPHGGPGCPRDRRISASFVLILRAVDNFVENLRWLGIRL